MTDLYDQDNGAAVFDDDDEERCPECGGLMVDAGFNMVFARGRLPLRGCPTCSPGAT